MKDFYEIMDFCGFDLEKTHDMAEKYTAWMNEAVEEALNDVGLETIRQ